MLGRLIQTAANYGRGNATLESTTEESHTRNLLYGQSHQTYSLTNSPPPSPYATPAFRPGSFDDHGGLELAEKDVRILIAQHVFGVEDKPTILFDSHAGRLVQSPPLSHVRHASMTGPRSPLPNDWRPPSQNTPAPPNDHPFRSRSSTLTGSSTQWNRPTRDLGTREEAYLECMFGATSSTKTSSTTKMHILPGRPKSAANPDVRNKVVGHGNENPVRKTPLQRSRTSNAILKSPTSHYLSGADTEAQSQGQDSILITRLFNVTLSEPVAATPRQSDDVISPQVYTIDEDIPNVASPTTPKKPKLVERKPPAFAIGLIIALPHHPEPHPVSIPIRPISRSAQNNTLSSASSSYGSDMQNSWSFLNAIPESLASSTLPTEESDRRIEMVVGNEDVILRAVALLEIESTRVIHQQLQDILNHVVGPALKTPKEKSMQRTNQRIVTISDATSVAKVQSLQDAAKQAVRRIIYALRIPRVIVGLGFGGGHWSDEARTAFIVCGRRQQNFFLFTLLTAFLGQHTQWLRRLAPEWYRKQYRSHSKQHDESHQLPHRTIIIADQRAVARRLIFLLASFLPGVQGLDGLQKPGEDLVGSLLSVSSPSSHIVRYESLRRTANRRMREHRLLSNNTEKILLSTSADSVDSITPTDRNRRFLARKNSDAMSVRGSVLLPMAENEGQRKASASTTTALPSQPAAPIAVFSTRQGTDFDSYFPPFADNDESIASAGLNSILRRSSSSMGNSSNMSSRWGSLVSGLSEMWTNKQPSSSDSGSTTAYSPTVRNAHRSNTESSLKRGKSSTLQDMVNQLEGNFPVVNRSPEMYNANRGTFSPLGFASPTKQVASAPRLRVDDRDGVVDVDLDLPGFGKFDGEELFKSPSKSGNQASTSGARDTAESIRSMRSIPAKSATAYASIDTNVAGYLKRHHEDFSLYAVKPYAELEEDVKRTMVAESLLPGHLDEFRTKLDETWSPVCTTVIADLRTFSVRKLTLKRKFVTESTGTDQTSPKKATDGGTTQQMFIDEEVKDFDTTLADAIERMVDVGEPVLGTPMLSPRIQHSRTTSSGTTKLTPPQGSSFRPSSYTGIPQEHVRQDCRQVVLGALEEIVKDVCNDLSKLDKGRDIQGSRSFDASAIKEEMRQENVLREGVKCWLLNLEQPRVF